MRILAFLFCFMLMAQSAFAALTMKLISTEKVDENTLKVTVELNYNGHTRTITRPVQFTAETTKPEVVQAMRNMAAEIKDRRLAELKLDQVKPSVDSEIGNTVVVEA